MLVEAGAERCPPFLYAFLCQALRHRLKALRQSQNERPEYGVGRKIIRAAAARFIVMIKRILQARGGASAETTPNAGAKHVARVVDAEGQTFGEIVLSVIGPRKGVATLKVRIGADGVGRVGQDCKDVSTVRDKRGVVVIESRHAGLLIGERP
jgi:hypothetical protein